MNFYNVVNSSQISNSSFLLDTKMDDVASVLKKIKNTSRINKSCGHLNGVTFSFLNDTKAKILTHDRFHDMVDGENINDSKQIIENVVLGNTNINVVSTMWSYQQCKDALFFMGKRKVNDNQFKIRQHILKRMSKLVKICFNKG